MIISRFPHTALLAASLACLSASCGGGSFEPASKLKGLRVLALQKEPAYAAPGETVNLKLLYWDGKATEGAPRDIQFNFFQCDDPPGDLYTQCFAAKLRPIFGGGPDVDAGSDATTTTTDASDAMDASDLPDSEAAGGGSDAGIEGGTTAPESDPIVTARVPISSEPVHPRAEGVTPYRLTYVLFTACAGHLGPDSDGMNGLPIACFDSAQKKLGPDDFVPGYSSIYIYDSIRNANPIVDPSLQTGFPSPQADGPHIPRCTASDRGDCPQFDVRPIIDRQSAEEDPEGKDGQGHLLKEQLWVAYYATDGDFTNTIRLVNDATQGWNDDNGTKFRAPASPGPVRVFAVVHDNRGGVAWAETRITVD